MAQYRVVKVAYIFPSFDCNAESNFRAAVHTMKKGEHSQTGPGEQERLKVKSEARNPKFESNPKSQNSKCEIPNIRISSHLGFVSDFVLRISGFNCLSLTAQINPIAIEGGNETFLPVGDDTCDSRRIDGTCVDRRSVRPFQKEQGVGVGGKSTMGQRHSSTFRDVGSRWKNEDRHHCGCCL
jgi:hypothetical protein